ncbi:GNAT family N-acetyltransferase [Patescibacteria group bacterium]|nr:GNAT family N-acetyltransferase [Patescibacteria group bacterium]
MKLILTKRKTKEMKDFSRKEWNIADKKHFGKKISWDEKQSYIRAEENNEIVGMIHYKITKGVMEIVTLLIGHNRQRQGFGKKLIQKVEQIAKKNNCHKLYLITGVGWNSIKFYKAMGFKETGKLQKHYLKKDWLEFSKFI